MGNTLMPIIFLWDNFGPLHADRCDAVALAAPNREILGLELYGSSDVYEWNTEVGTRFKKTTLFKHGRPRRQTLLKALFQFRKMKGRGIWFLCHYDWPEIFLFAIWLRFLGDKVFTMGCSKFDDHPRLAFREWQKSFFLAPYQGAIGSGSRSRDYFRFLGINSAKVVGEYNTVSLARIRLLAGAIPAPDGLCYAERHFTIVARLVSKKNIASALNAYAHYQRLDPNPRDMHICGSGPLEGELRSQAAALGISEKVFFNGFVQTDVIARFLATTLTLILSSTEEQFGNVVIEAQSMGLPVILSSNCGARDNLVRSGVNGFVVEPDNPEGMAWFMAQLAMNEDLWAKMCKSTTEFAKLSDVAAFANGALYLSGSRSI